MFRIECKSKEITYTHDLNEFKNNSIVIISEGLSNDEICILYEGYCNQGVSEVVCAYTQPRFFACIIDIQKNIIFVINDKFGSNDIFYTQSDQDFVIASNIDSLVVDPKLCAHSVYEMLSFYTILPPHTIYEDVYTLGLGSVMCFEKGEVKHSIYWDTRKYKNDSVSYDIHVKNVRDAFLNVIRGYADKNGGVALSGGIDSGGVLGMLTHIYKSSFPSITFGGHGKETPDLQSSRQTAKEQGSSNVELYPSLNALKELPRYMEGLSQPIAGDVVFPNGMLFDEAKRQKLTSLNFGFGAEMLLGNLKIVRMYDRLRLESFVPKMIRDKIYQFLGAIFGFSKNRIDFLTAQSWIHRFMRARGPLFTREYHIYKRLPEHFNEVIAKKLEDVVGGVVDNVEDLVLLYVHGWVNYLQLRDHGQIARAFNIKVFSPFDTPQVSELLLATPHAFRRKNQWNKQVLRDVMKPYVSDRLYHREVRSLVVPYTSFFNGAEKDLFAYLKEGVVADYIDIEAFEQKYHTFPEPGLLLMRLIAFSLWYETHWDKQRVSLFEKVIDNV